MERLFLYGLTALIIAGAVWYPGEIRAALDWLAAV